MTIRAVAQQPQESKGDYLVLTSGDTLWGEVQDINYNGVAPKYSKKISIRSKEGKRRKINRQSVKMFQKQGAIYEAFYLRAEAKRGSLLDLSYTITEKRGKLYFLKQVAVGPLNHYHLEWFEQGDAMHNYMDLIRKSNDDKFIRATQGIFGLKKKAVAQYLSECGALQNQIERKQLKTITEVVAFYNSFCI